MERKATAFVEQFSATLFAQWTQQQDKTELFWKNASFLRNVLEEGVAKLPKVPVKAHLNRELARFVELLRSQLQSKYTEFQAQTTPATARDAFPSLLNEEDVERALATATSAELQNKLHSVLALDDTTAKRLEDATTDPKQTTEQLVATLDQCVVQLNIVGARRYESVSENARKSAFYLQLITRCVEQIARKWCESSRNRTWVCDADSKLSGEREKLRMLLQSLVVADVVSSTQTQMQHTPSWSSFFRPQDGAVFRNGVVDGTSARAGVYGALLALAVSFPIVFEDDDDSSDSDDSSSGSSSDSDADTHDANGNDDDDDEQADSPKSRRRAAALKRALKKRERLDCVALAKQVARQVVLAATPSHEDGSKGNWYLAVLAAFHRVAKPTKLVTENGDEDDNDNSTSEQALTTHQHRALQDTLAELYGRAFAGGVAVFATSLPPLALLETLLCLRHAAEFMRVDRKQTVPAIASATSQLAGVALPSAFWRFMAHVKKVFAGEHAVVQAVMKKLSKHKSDKKTANVLMHDSVLTLSDLRVVVEQFALFLAAETERAHFVVARVPTATESGEPQGDEDAGESADQVLFFTDNAGGGGGNKSKKRDAEAETVANAPPHRDEPQSKSQRKRAKSAKAAAK